ncbi:MAG TPA: hypothetical protein VN853_05795 [Polyangia bacterium]|nr:hypothetical protein [Polyangia bacterium]
MRWLRIASLAVTLLLTGCAGDPSAGFDDAGPPPDAGAACNSTLTYQSFGASFLTTNCGGCHLWTHADAQSDGIALSGVVVQGSMPPGSSLSASQRQEFADWIACGAP